MKPQTLEERANGIIINQLCPYAETCSESNYGNEEICLNDYFDCKLHLNFLKQGIETYPKLKRRLRE